MAKYRVKAYFMHEHEEKAAKQAVESKAISAAEWTPGYVIGVRRERDQAPGGKRAGGRPRRRPGRQNGRSAPQRTWYGHTAPAICRSFANGSRIADTSHWGKIKRLSG